MQCKYFGSCGGCSAQHIPYETQLQNKKNVVFHNTDFEDIKVFSGNPFNYRNRMDLIFHSRGLGFREKGKWQNIVDIDECLISNVQLNKLLNEVRENFKDIDYFDLRKQTGTFRYAVIRTPGKSSSISFVLNSDSTRITEGIERIKGYAKISSAENIAVTYAKHNEDRSITEDYFMVKGSDMLHDTFHGKDFFYNVQGFFQNNPQMAEQMLGYVHELLKKYETKDALLVDLYGGVGTFGLVNSELFKQVYVVESFKGSIDAADINIKHNNIKNAKGFVMDAKNVKKLNLFEPLFMIIDPPRTGLEQKALLAIKELKPKVIIYISCNPAQLAKELPKLKMNLKSVAMFDLFPQTPHVEAVLELTRD